MNVGEITRNCGRRIFTVKLTQFSTILLRVTFPSKTIHVSFQKGATERCAARWTEDVLAEVLSAVSGGAPGRRPRRDRGEPCAVRAAEDAGRGCAPRLPRGEGRAEPRSAERPTARAVACAKKVALGTLSGFGCFLSAVTFPQVFATFSRQS